MITIYEYIASHDPIAVEAICNKYGYVMQDANGVEDLGVCLQQLVATEGEEVMRDLADIHPDKALILETFGDKTPATKPGCGCGGKCGEQNAAKQYVDTAQSQMGLGFLSTNQSGLFIMAGTLLILAAIIIKN